MLGASNPLWTLLVAQGPKVRLPVEGADRLLGLVCFVLAAMLATRLVDGGSGFVAALLVALTLPATVLWQTQALSGLEVPLAAVLGLAALLAVRASRDLLAGILLGLALWNKLDALAVVVAVIVAMRLTHGRWPWRTTVAALVVAAPWFLFAWFYFGSPWPHSVAAKLARNAVAPVSHAWMIRALSQGRHWLLALGVGIGLWESRRAPAAIRLPIQALAIWLAIHVAAYSLVGLGDEYPWYLGLPAMLLVLVPCAAAGINRRSLALASVIVVAATVQDWTAVASAILSRGPLSLGDAFDTDRRLAGIFLDEFGAPTEVVQSSFGWVAFESHRAFVDASGLNSIATPVGAPDYVVTHGVPWRDGNSPPVTPAGYVPLATFDLAHRLYPGTTWFAVFGKPDSAIARLHKSERDVDVSRLESVRLADAWTRR